MPIKLHYSCYKTKSRRLRATRLCQGLLKIIRPDHKVISKREGEDMKAYFGSLSVWRRELFYEHRQQNRNSGNSNRRS